MNLNELIAAALIDPKNTDGITLYWDAQDSSDEGPAYRLADNAGSGALEMDGWACTDGSEPDVQGYELAAYFLHNGEYAGPDQYGVYPELAA